jgi:hypothetical protein
MIAYATSNQFVVEYAITSCFNHVPQRIVILVVTKMVDLNISRKQIS